MLILVVLSLLILFVVIAVMFVAVATRARSVANTYSNVGRTGDAPRETLDNALFDILRGSTNPYSPFRNHSLLEDTYGHLSIRGQVSVFTLLQGGIADVDASFRSGPAGEPRIDGFSPVKDAYSGCVLTFVTGNLRGVSARILEYWPAGTRTVPIPNASPGFRLMLIASEHGRDFWPQSIGQSEFVINGRPFSGTGVGYNADAGSPGFGRLTATEPPNDPATGATGQPYALLPNPVFFTPNIVPDVPPRRFDHYLDPSGAGGANEDYDAPDYHNLFLGYYASPILTDTRQIKPSFHDPALIDYWTDTLGNFFAAKDAHVWRKVMLRPNPTDHPRFPVLGDAVVGPWDIDNDGDGLTDSVWIDPGYPVLMTKQGKLYKALVAPLVLDMDGRLNLNAHGSVQELVQATQMPSRRPLRQPKCLPVG